MRHPLMVKPALFGLVFLVLGCSLPAAEPPASEPGGEPGEVLPLSSLQPSCRIWKRWVGSAMLLPWGAWLECGETGVLLTHPWNLLGNVDIRTPEQALEYVRFFSSKDSYQLFQLEGLVEIRRETSEKDWGQDIIARTGLKDRFHPPQVREITETTTCVDRLGKEKPCERKVFFIKRIVLLYDQNIYEIEEAVRQDGFYSVPSRHLLIKDVERFGFLHQGPY